MTTKSIGILFEHNASLFHSTKWSRGGRCTIVVVTIVVVVPSVRLFRLIAVRFSVPSSGTGDSAGKKIDRFLFLCLNNILWNGKPSWNDGAPNFGGSLLTSDRSRCLSVRREDREMRNRDSHYPVCELFAWYFLECVCASVDSHECSSPWSKKNFRSGGWNTANRIIYHQFFFMMSFDAVIQSTRSSLCDSVQQ